MQLIFHNANGKKNCPGRGLAGAALAALLCASSGWAQISLVHTTNCGPGGFPGTTCTVPATGSGNLIVIGWEMVQPSSGVTISSISDNAGNTYAEAGAAKSSYASASTDLWYAKNSKSGATSLTITTSGSVSLAGAVIWEFSGVDQTAPLDVTAVLNNQGSSSTPVSPTVVTTAPGDVIVALVDVDNQINGIASGNAFTSDSSLMNNGFAHLITSPAGAYFAQWNESPAGAYTSSAVAFKAATSGSGGTTGTSGSGNGTQSAGPCDLNSDGTVNNSDVNLAVGMALGTSSCAASVEGPLTCTVITVQRVINASLGQTCITYNTHAVSLNWVASSSPNVIGYNIYRGASSTGPFSKINSSLIGGTSYSDGSVQAGQTYYYVATAVNSSGQESSYSTSITAVIPNP